MMDLVEPYSRGPQKVLVGVKIKCRGRGVWPASPLPAASPAAAAAAQGYHLTDESKELLQYALAHLVRPRDTIVATYVVQCVVSPDGHKRPVSAVAPAVLVEQLRSLEAVLSKLLFPVVHHFGVKQVYVEPRVVHANEARVALAEEALSQRVAEVLVGTSGRRGRTGQLQGPGSFCMASLPPTSTVTVVKSGGQMVLCSPGEAAGGVRPQEVPWDAASTTPSPNGPAQERQRSPQSISPTILAPLRLASRFVSRRSSSQEAARDLARDSAVDGSGCGEVVNPARGAAPDVAALPAEAGEGESFLSAVSDLPSPPHSPAFANVPGRGESPPASPFTSTASTPRSGASADGGSPARSVGESAISLSSPPQKLFWPSGRQPPPVFPYEELAAATGGFAEHNIIGTGRCAVVYRGETPGGLEIAVKRIRRGGRPEDLPQQLKEMRTEVKILGRVHHRSVLALRGCCVHRRECLLVFDYVPNGPLSEYLADPTRPRLPWSARQRIALTMARTIQYLHEARRPVIIHRDVKSANILLNQDLQPLLTDYGLAKLKRDHEEHVKCTHTHGTFGYLAPEYVESGFVDEKTDVYAFGVVLFELISGKPPVNSRGESLVEWAWELRDDKDTLADPRLEGQYNHYQLRRMIAAAALCVRVDPANRPTMREVVGWLDRSPVQGFHVDSTAFLSLQGPGSARHSFPPGHSSLAE
eukprot:SM000187S03881  [mRNA]  locus=s187:264112:268628:+ [translate_table: standard]